MAEETRCNGKEFARRLLGKNFLHEECWKMTSGGWSQKGKRKCQKSLSCRMRWKAFSWTWVAKAAVSAKLLRRGREMLNEDEEIRNPKKEK